MCDLKKPQIVVYFSQNILQYQESYHRYQQSLDTLEVEKALGFKRDILRQRYIIAHGLLRQVLAEYVDESAGQLRFGYTERGKPFLVDYPKLSFNLSHTEDSWALAVIPQACQLGIDIERSKIRSHLQGLVDKCFSTEEAAHWHSLSSDQQAYFFYAYWVRKEAFVKAVGQGITLGLNRCALNAQTELNSFLSVPASCGLADDWQVYPLDFAQDLHGAVVCDQKNSSLRQQEI